MKRLLVACLCAVLACEAAAATVKGRVAFVTKRGQSPAVAETLVWLEAADGARLPRRAPVTARVTTRGKVIIPHVIAIPVGSTVLFPNEDPIAHNVFSLSAGNQFDLGLYRTGAGRPHVFDDPGIVNVYCNVHPNMSAVIHVVDTPYYVFADGKGSFTLSDVPPGRYDVVAWNEQAGTARLESLEVHAAGVSSLVVTLDSRSYRNFPHPNKAGKPYEPPSRARDY